MVSIFEILVNWESGGNSCGGKGGGGTGEPKIWNLEYSNAIDKESIASFESGI